MIRVALVSFFLVFGLSMPAFAQTYPNPDLAASTITMRLAVSGGNQLPRGSKLAIVPFLHEDGSVSRFSRYFASLMTSSVTKTGGFQPLERARLDSIVHEIVFSYSGMVDASNVVEIGKLQGADAMIVGEFVDDGDYLNVNCRMVVVESGKVAGVSATRIKKSRSMTGMMSHREPKPTTSNLHAELNQSNPSSQPQEIQKLEEIFPEFTEVFFGGNGFRYKLRNVKINGSGNVVKVQPGSKVNVTMELLHDCESCGGAMNQIIVGLGGEESAQVSVWHGGQRSGGYYSQVGSGTTIQYYQNNPDKAEWVTVVYEIQVPKERGVHYLRSRYAQAMTGKLRIKELKTRFQRDDSETLGWWKIDRVNGPGSESNIGALIVE